MDDIRKPDLTPTKTSADPTTKIKRKPDDAGMPKKTKKAPKRRLSKIFLAFLVVLLIALLAGSAYLYKQYKDTQNQVNKLSTVQGQQELSKTQTNQLLGEMRSIILLPSNEDPVVATVTDINLLKSQPFYQDAKNGDRVVVFVNAKKAYIYRPDEKKIINVGAFETEAPSQ